MARTGTARSAPPNRPRLSLLTLALALAVIVGATGLLKSGALNGLFAPPGAPVPPATQTALAEMRSADGTQTAQSVMLNSPYRPKGVGPCAPPNQRASAADQSYWFWPPDSSVTCEADGATARLAPPSFLAFRGFPGESAFPQAFIVAVTVAMFGDSPQICAQVTVNLPGDANPQRGVGVCGDGTWYAPNTSGVETPQPLPVSLAGPLRFVITVTATTIALSVNGRQLLAPASFSGQIDSIEISANGLPDDAMSASDFSITPTAS